MDVSPPQPDPQLPARRPYGSITLPFAVTAPRPREVRPAAAPEHWQAGRVRLPPLSIDELRYDRRSG